MYSALFFCFLKTEAGMGFRICEITSRAIFLSPISVGWTGFTLQAAIGYPLLRGCPRRKNFYHEGEKGA